MATWSRYNAGDARFDPASLPQHWARLHRCDAEPLPADGAVLQAWVFFHNGDFQQAAEAGLQAGGDGVAQDVHFHRAIAEAAGNPFLLQTLAYLGQFLHGATQVTRANEARRVDFAAQVQAEHSAIVQAVQAGDAQAARQAASAHMDNAITRIQSADPAFWVQEGERLAQPLIKGLRSTP